MQTFGVVIPPDLAQQFGTNVSKLGRAVTVGRSRREDPVLLVCGTRI